MDRVHIQNAQPRGFFARQVIWATTARMTAHHQQPWEALERVFIDKSAQPTDEILQSVLGAAYPCFATLREVTADKVQEWKFYNKKSGWVFKAIHKKKTVFYLTPLRGCVLLSMALNEAEKASVLEGDAEDAMKRELASAKKFPEGYPLRTLVRTKRDLDGMMGVLQLTGRI